MKRYIDTLENRKCLYLTVEEYARFTPKALTSFQEYKRGSVYSVACNFRQAVASKLLPNKYKVIKFTDYITAERTWNFNHGVLLNVNQATKGISFVNLDLPPAYKENNFAFPVQFLEPIRTKASKTKPKTDIKIVEIL
ncbi:MAG: hypothetical protein HY376_02035 [Candidatus Blackburnbacteria bacterium]|nr:hypothetical protein [Candidatus Blackburnbacteria bacterium]